jgi:hypothetical protein
MDIVIPPKETANNQPGPSSGNHVMVRSLDTTSRRTDEKFFHKSTIIKARFG